MTNILNIILYITFALVPIFGGALFIYDSVHAFLRKQYFKFGLTTMMAVYFITYLVRHLLRGI